MKILIVTHYFQPHVGGIEIVAYNQAKELVKQGHEVTIVSSRIGDEKEREIIDGIKVIRVKAWNFFEKKFGIPYPVFSLRLIKVLNEEVKNTDIVHVHDIGYLSSFMATLIGKTKKKPVVLMQHITTINKGLITNLIQKIVRLTYGNYIIKSSKKIIVCNELVKDWLNQKDKTIFLHNAGDINLFKPVTEKKKIELKKKYKLSLNKPVVLFVGRLVGKKGFDKLFEAKDKDYFILFVGDGEVPKYMKNQENTKFIKAKSQNKLAELYQLSDIFCLPSKNEGFPLTILEAMASGLPIITTGHEGYEHYLDRKYVKLIDSTPEEIKKTIKEVLNNKDEMLRISKYSREEAVNKFGWEKNVKSLLNVYSEVKI